MNKDLLRTPEANLLVRRACNTSFINRSKGSQRLPSHVALVVKNPSEKPVVADYVLPRSEEARRYFRTVYDFPQWQKHRSQLRLIDRLLQIPRSHVLQNILPSIAWCSSVAGLLTLYMQAYDAHVLPDGFPSFSPNNACTSFVNTTTVALSLLLVFRTNVSYGRWDEARKMKGLLVNRSRDLMRQACAMLPAEDIETKAMMAKWTAAFCRVLRIHFQPEVSLEDEMKGLLSPEELQWLQESKHRPCSVIHVLSQIIYDSQISAICQAQMCNNLTAFEDVLGGCERLLRAPIPVSYTRHTARFLFTWLTLLPFALYASCGVWTLPVVAGVSAVLCGIEEIGVQIEEPFGILPLEAICGRIQADVMATLREDEKTRNLRRKVIQSRQLELRELASGSPSK